MKISGTDERDRVGRIRVIRDGAGVAAQQGRCGIGGRELRLGAGGAEDFERFGGHVRGDESEQRTDEGDPSPSTRLGMTRAHHLPSASFVNMRSGLSWAT